MKRITPNWSDVCNVLVFKLDEIADEVDFSLEYEEDPMSIALNAVDELKAFIYTVENDPAAFSTEDAS